MELNHAPHFKNKTDFLVYKSRTNPKGIPNDECNEKSWLQYLEICQDKFRLYLAECLVDG